MTAAAPEGGFVAGAIAGPHTPREVTMSLPTLLLVGFLLAHAAIHLGFLSPRPATTAGAPAWPFELAHSRPLAALGLDPGVARGVGRGLVAVTLGGFAVAAIGALGILPRDAWFAAASVGAIASASLLLLYFHPWLVLGVAIDVALLWVVLVARWVPDALGA